MSMLQAGSHSPEFFLTDPQGRRQASTELLSGGPVLLAFYKSSCPVCQLTLPFLQRISEGSLRIMAVSQDNAPDTSRFQEKFAITMPTLLDRAEDVYPASNAFGITNVPSLFLIEPDGTVSVASSGFGKANLEALGTRAGVTVFRPDEKVPEWKAG